MDRQFYWGAASAAFQIEGAYLEDGKGLSIWDVMTHEPGRTKRGDTGDVACDHYHRFREDVRLMADLGLSAYRFSISWPRVLPDGTGEPNEKGLAFYSDLIDELLSHGIEPFVTLYHWDLPQSLFLRGGWLSPESPGWFAAYARLIGRRFGDRVRHFITVNEPDNVLQGLTETGGNAPGLPYALPDRLAAAHNLLKAHGRAVRELREAAPDAEIGFAPCCVVECPADGRKESEEAARKKFFSHERGKLAGEHTVTLYSDPVFLGDYPEEYYAFYRGLHPEITGEDLALISQPVDFCFQNIYTGVPVRAGEDGKAEPVPFRGAYNMLGWNVMPEALYWGPKFLYGRYGKPVMITENGFVSPDAVSLDGKVHDPGRIDYLQRYLAQLGRAARDGTDIRGYFYWSFTDNLEWELGFEPRFGLVHVDFGTQKRTPKDSFEYYRGRIRKPL